MNLSDIRGTTITAEDDRAGMIKAVFVDGVEMKDCDAFNIEQGWADVIDLPKVTHTTQRWPHRRIFGKVTVLMRS